MEDATIAPVDGRLVEAVITWMLCEFEEATGVNLRPTRLTLPEKWERLERSAREAIKGLASRPVAHVVIQALTDTEPDLDVRLSREKLDELSSWSEYRDLEEGLNIVIVRHFIRQILEQHGIDVSGDPFAWMRLEEAAEKAKHQFATRSQVVISVPFLARRAGEHIHFATRMTWADYAPLRASVVVACEPD